MRERERERNAKASILFTHHAGKLYEYEALPSSYNREKKKPKIVENSLGCMNDVMGANYPFLLFDFGNHFFLAERERERERERDWLKKLSKSEKDKEKIG